MQVFKREEALDNRPKLSISINGSCWNTSPHAFSPPSSVLVLMQYNPEIRAVLFLKSAGVLKAWAGAEMVWADVEILTSLETADESSRQLTN